MSGVHTISIVNAEYRDPAGSGYHPPNTEEPFWRDPEGRRVSVKEVWAGADEETKLLIFDITFAFFTQSYSAAFRKATAEGKIFRGSGNHDLLSELQSQLGPLHWVVK